jgi:hypothetical protein
MIIKIHKVVQQMKKNKVLGYIILAIAFALFNLIAFIIPIDRLAAFWTVYSFTVVAFVAQIAVWAVAFRRADTLRSKFLGFPIIRIGAVYLIIQLIAFAVFLALPSAPYWIPLIVCALILGIAAICLITTEVGRDEIVRVDEKVSQKTSFIAELGVKVQLLAESEKDPAIRFSLTDLAENIRFSDPMSAESLYSLEADIGEKISALKTADRGSLVANIDEIQKLLSERNNRCKALK